MTTDSLKGGRSAQHTSTIELTEDQQEMLKPHAIHTTDTVNPHMIGVGMPAAMLLDEFGSQVWSAFGSPPYLVGTAATGKQWRDVDVRLILRDEEYAAMGFGDPDRPHQNAKWISLCLAYSALGKQLTGLPIDFQIQQMTTCNKKFDGVRHALGLIELRMAK